MGKRYFDRIVDSMQAPEARPHTPQFRIEAEKRGFTLYDGDRAIGLFWTRDSFALDLWGLSPFEDDVCANATAHPYVWDMHTARNSHVNLPYYHADDLFEGVVDRHAAMELTWEQDAGSELRVRIEGRFAEQQRLLYTLTLRYDAAWARYRCFVNVDAWKLSPKGFEPLNFMMVGALRGASRSRWSHSVYEDMEGQLRRIVHSNALFMATDYGCPTGTWRTKWAPLTKPWVAYALNDDCNPAMLVHACNVPMVIATCSQLFDEHLIWRDAALEQLEENCFHFRMHTEFVNIGPALARELLEGAQDPPAPREWRVKRTALPFRMERVNDLESPVDVWQEEDCTLFVVENAADAAARWVDDAARSGRHSLRLEGRCWHDWTRLAPVGAVCEIAPGTKHRLTGWIKTRDVDRFARLELATYEYTYSNKVNIAQSAKVTGDADWTEVSATLDCDDGAYVVPTLEVYGLGTAWFDDLKLEQVRDAT